MIETQETAGTEALSGPQFSYSCPVCGERLPAGAPMCPNCAAGREEIFECRYED